MRAERLRASRAGARRPAHPTLASRCAKSADGGRGRCAQGCGAASCARVWAGASHTPTSSCATAARSTWTNVIVCCGPVLTVTRPASDASTAQPSTCNTAWWQRRSRLPPSAAGS
eukprot:345539-Prymnesium_polylepis.1